jgi:predicted RNA-binding Zn ribbon-like protein
VTNADREIAGFDRLGDALCLDFVNTADWDEATPINDGLTHYAALVHWAQHVSLLSQERSQQLFSRAEQYLDEAQIVFQRAVVLRDALRVVFGAIANHHAPDGRSLHQFNQELTSASPHLRVAYGVEGYTWQWQTDTFALDSVLWPIVWSAAQLLSTGDLERVKKCPGERCGWLFIDSSRNRSRRWCDMKECGNRAKASRYYQKHQHLKED